MGFTVRHAYYEAVLLVERVHRHFLEVVKSDLDRAGVQDINNVQALILYNIGTDEMTVGELTARGYYLGSNVSYNVKKMVENGYLVQERSPHDRRSIRVRLSPKGLDLCAKLDGMHDRHINNLAATQVDHNALTEASVTLRRLDRFWTQIVDRGVRILPRMTNSAA